MRPENELVQEIDRPPGVHAVALWLIGLGLLIGLLDMARLSFGLWAQGRPVLWGMVAASTLPYWVTLGLALAVLVRTVRWFPLRRGHWRRSIPFHLTVAVLFSACHAVGAGLLADLLYVGRVISVTPHLWKVLQLIPVIGFFSYAAAVAAVSAIDSHQRFLERERAAARYALRAADLEASLAQARLEALRIQLNPHFLFNTLNAASVLALKGEGEKVVAMLVRLSDFLRIVLEHSDQVVPLAEELDLLSHYLEIERVRFEDRLDLRFDVAQEALGVEVPSLVLQPLAENAIRHGIARIPGRGHLEIRARLAGERLVLEVLDSGPGLEAADPPSEGVGLTNTRARLEQIYGGAAALELSSAPAGGGLIRLTLPLRPAAAGGGEREEAMADAGPP